MSQTRVFTPLWTPLRLLFGFGVLFQFQWSNDGIWWTRDVNANHVNAWFGFGHIVHAKPTYPTAYYITLWKLNVLFGFLS